MPNRRVVRYAVPVSCWLPSDLPEPDSYSACAETAEWYAVVAVPLNGEDDAVITDIRRSDWDVPSGVVDRRDDGPHPFVDGAL